MGDVEKKNRGEKNGKKTKRQNKQHVLFCLKGEKKREKGEDLSLISHIFNDHFFVTISKINA